MLPIISLTAALAALTMATVFMPQRYPRRATDPACIRRDTDRPIAPRDSTAFRERTISPRQITDAHRTMQWHRECSVRDCDEKSYAYELLVAAGRIVPQGEGAR